jgi:hypothetical protein
MTPSRQRRISYRKTRKRARRRFPTGPSTATPSAAPFASGEGPRASPPQSDTEPGGRSREEGGVSPPPDHEGGPESAPDTEPEGLIAGKGGGVRALKG